MKYTDKKLLREEKVSSSSQFQTTAYHRQEVRKLKQLVTFTVESRDSIRAFVTARVQLSQFRVLLMKRFCPTLGRTFPLQLNQPRKVPTGMWADQPNLQFLTETPSQVILDRIKSTTGTNHCTPWFEAHRLVCHSGPPCLLRHKMLRASMA